MKKNKKIQLLDCTFRDGGQCLQASYLYGLKGASFSKDIISRGISHLSRSGCDIVEVGYVDDNFEKMAGYASYSDMALLSKNIPINRQKQQLFIGLFTGPDAPVDAIPQCDDELVDGIRVILRYSELKKSLDFCEMLIEKGYRVFIQPMLTMRYTEDDLILCIDKANKIGAYAIYFVDSFGYMTVEDVDKLFHFYNGKLNPGIKVGFHSHNNLNLAYTNTIRFIDNAMNSDRDIIIDSTCLGIGQGAGNLQSEIIVPYLNDKYEKSYNFDEILETCELIESLTNVTQWGYSLMWVLPAMYKSAYKYSLVMREKLGLPYIIINKIFRTMPDELRHRYTKDNLLMLLEREGVKIDDGKF